MRNGFVVGVLLVPLLMGCGQKVTQETQDTSTTVATSATVVGSGTGVPG